MFHVVSICNALIDLVVDATDEDIHKLMLNKGAMQLVPPGPQKDILDYFAGRERLVSLGGSGLNTIRALALLGRQTGFAGKVGKDSWGREVSNRIKDLGIHAHLAEDSEEPTGTCVVMVTPDGERTMATCLGASRLFDQNIFPQEHVTESKVFHFTAYQLGSIIQSEAIRRALRIAKSHGVRISLDLADPFVVGFHREELMDLIKSYASIVFANREEARLLMGYDDPAETAYAISRLGAIAVIKLGAQGAIIREEDTSHFVPPIRTTVVDTTGAGDMFAAGFLYGQTGGRSLLDSGRGGAILASDVISRYGACLSQEALDATRDLLG